MAAAMTPSQLLEIRRVRAMASSAPNTPENNCFRGEKGDKGDPGEPGLPGLSGTPLGNVLLVDLVNQPTNTTSFSSISDAISAITTGNLENQTIWLLPGIHILQNEIAIPRDCSIRGISAQTVYIRMQNVIADTTMITMGKNTSIEDCTIQLTSSDPHNLTCIHFLDDSTFTSKVKGCNIYVENFDESTLTDVTGVLADGFGVRNTSSELIEPANSGSLACIENSTIQIISNYAGRKRGIYVTGGANDYTNILAIKNTSIFIKNPITVDPSGNLLGNFSWCAVENNSAHSKIICFTSILSGPTTASHLDNSDISQTLGEIIIGEGTTLVNKRPRLKPSSSVLCYPFKFLTDRTTLFYAAIGKIKNHDPDKDGFLLPGTMMIQNYVPSGTYPSWMNITAPVFDFKYPIPSTSQIPSTPSINVQGAYYSITKRSILMSARVRLGKRQTIGSTGNVFSISVKVYYDRPYNPGTGPQQLFSITLINNQINNTYNSNSGVFLLEEGGELRVSMNYTGGVGTDNLTGNLGEDLYVELELY